MEIDLLLTLDDGTTRHIVADDLAAADATLQHVLELAEAGAWVPEKHPRWPHGAHGGEFMRVTDLLADLGKAQDGRMNVSFLAHGAQRIQSVEAVKQSDNHVSFNVLTRDGQHHEIAANAGADMSHVMAAMQHVDSGNAAPRAAGAGAPNASAPNAPGKPGVGAPAVPGKAAQAPQAPGAGSSAPGSAPSAASAAESAAHRAENPPGPEHRGKAAPPPVEQRDGPFAQAVEDRLFRSVINDARSVNGWGTVLKHGAIVNGEPVFKADRASEHERILSYWMAPGKPVPRGQTPQALFFAGGSGSGKGHVLKGGYAADATPENAVHIDPDEMKMMLPEWDPLIEAGSTRGAAFTHEESSTLGKQLMRRAIQQHMNIVVDGTGDGGPGNFLKKLKAAKRAGHDVNVMWVDAPTDFALENAQKREVRTGRRVDETVLRSIHQAVAATHLEWREDPDISSWVAYHNDNGRDPVKVAEGGGGKYTVLNQALYDVMLAKAEEGKAANDAARTERHASTGQQAAPVPDVVRAAAKDTRASARKSAKATQQQVQRARAGTKGKKGVARKQAQQQLAELKQEAKK